MYESKNIPIGKKLEKVIIVGLKTKKIPQEFFDESMRELELLVGSAGGQVVARLIQTLCHPVSATFIGKGKLVELSELVRKHEVETVIFDDDLKPNQTREIEKALDDKVKVLDRSGLILDIFATRARTLESRIQVELAQLEYLKPRLSGLWSHFSRQWGGSIGARGPGETQLETDRRGIDKKIALLKNKLSRIEKSRKIQRKSRSGKFRISLLGYTNAGKSTLLNALTKASVYVEDKLFATLDPRTKIFRDADKNLFLITDTIGFIRKLPHDLIESFRSTLAEAEEADLIIIVADATHPAVGEHLNIVETELFRMGITEKPRILVFNKVDLIDGLTIAGLVRKYPDAIYISALKKRGLRELISKIKTIASLKLCALDSPETELQRNECSDEIQYNQSNSAD